MAFSNCWPVHPRSPAGVAHISIPLKECVPQVSISETWEGSEACLSEILSEIRPYFAAVNLRLSRRFPPLPPQCLETGQYLQKNLKFTPIPPIFRGMASS